MYRFYIRMNDKVFGPYSTEKMIELNVLDDIPVREESIGEWNPAGYYNFSELLQMERQTNQERNVIQTIVCPAFENQDQELSNNMTDPHIVGKWNWGAFFFGWLWSIFNGIYWPLILILFNFIPYIGWIIYLAIHVVLGINGNEWAWESNNKKWKDASEFIRIQNYWTIAAIVVFCCSFLIGIIIGILAVL